MLTDIDHLLIEDCLLVKVEQPAWTGERPVLVED